VAKVSILNTKLNAYGNFTPCRSTNPANRKLEHSLG